MAGGIQNDGNRPGGPVTWVFNDQDLENLLEAIRVGQEVIIDLETTGLVDYAWAGGKLNGGYPARIVLASLTIPDATEPAGDEWDGREPTTWIVPLSHPDSPFSGRWREVMKLMLLAMLETSRPISNVNVKFDSRWWFRHTGVDVTHLIAWDPQVASHVIDETMPRRLKERVPQIFGIDNWADVDFTKPGEAERVDLFQLGEYAARDTYWTWRWKRHDMREMYLIDREAGDDPVFPEEVQMARFGKLCTWVVMPSVRSLTRIEQRGFRLDIPWCREHLEEYTHKREAGLDKLAQILEMPRRGASIAATSHWFIEAMKRAVDAKLLHVASLTPNGNPQWSKGVLTRQARQWEGPEELNLAQLVLDTRSATKLSEYLQAWLNLVSKDGFIYAKYNVGSVATGRLSSSEPNMQQVTKKLRPAFIPRDDRFVIAAIDYSQIELRMAAFLSRSVPMMQAYIEGKDLHAMLAATINGMTEEEFARHPNRDLLRTQAKAGNFGLLYLMGAMGFREYAETTYGVVLTEQEAVRIYRAFFEQWKGIREWHQQSIAKAHRDGYITSPLGRVRRLPGIYSPNENMVRYSERAAVNSPVQGTASDLMMMGLASCQGLLPGTEPVYGAFPVNTVHDEGTFEILADRAEEIVAECRDRMENLNPWLRKMGVELDVPLVADATVGTRWSLSDVSDTWRKKDEAAA